MEGENRAARTGLRDVVAEDSALLREGLVRLLTEEGHTVAAVGDAPSLVQAVREEPRPDIVVIDVRMPPSHTSDGLQAAVRIRREWPEVGVLVLSLVRGTGVRHPAVHGEHPRGGVPAQGPGGPGR